MSDREQDKLGQRAGNWEEWQLTAFVLGELDEETMDCIQSAAADDAVLSADITEIQRTIGEVRHAFASEQNRALAVGSGERLQQILGRAGEEVGLPTVTAATIQKNNTGTARRVGLVGLAAAASVLLVTWLAFPQVFRGTRATQLADHRDLPSQATDEMPSDYYLNDDAGYQTGASAQPGGRSSNSSPTGKPTQESEEASLESNAPEVASKQSSEIAKGTGASNSSVSSAFGTVDESAIRTSAGTQGQAAASRSNSAGPRGGKSEGGPGDQDLLLARNAPPGAPFADPAQQSGAGPGGPVGSRMSGSGMAGNQGMGMGGYGGAASGASGGGYGEGSNGGGYGEGSNGGGYGGGGMAGGGYGSEGAGYGGELSGDPNAVGGYGGYGGGEGGMATAPGYANSPANPAAGLPIPVAPAAQAQGAQLSESRQARLANGAADVPAFGGFDGTASFGEVQQQEEAKLALSQTPAPAANQPAPTQVYAFGSGMTTTQSLAKNRGGYAADSADKENRYSVSSHRPYPGQPTGDRFESIYENRFLDVEDAQLSTLSIDVDTASYTKTRQLLLEARRLPPAGAVRIEEFVNYFDYEYAGPKDKEQTPFGANLAIADCPWNAKHHLVRIALQAEKINLAERPQANIVFLLDVSGSMDEPNKLPLVKETMRMLIKQLGENDRIAMVVYAGAAGCVLEGTRGHEQKKILAALDELEAGGSTNGGQGIQLAYQLARDGFVEGGINRVILCTDGDFNVGVTSTSSLVDLVEENAKSNVFLTVLGYGMGNTNDEMMEQISNRGNGVYGFVDNQREAYRQMVQQLAGNLMTVAKDVKIQVEFNPERVTAYRLLGYENRVMAAKDFADDTKDAGEIGAGHRVTALYEIVPAGEFVSEKAELELRYGSAKSQADRVAPEPQNQADGGLAREWLAVKLRFKKPEGSRSTEVIFPLDDQVTAFEDADRDFRWAASMAEFGMLLRHSHFRGNASWSALIEQAKQAAGVSPDVDRQECLEMIRTAAGLADR